MPYQPDPNSKTSKARKKRGFRSLEESSRKHRRARNRSLFARTQYGKLGQPGEKMKDGNNSFVHIAGGSINYH